MKINQFIILSLLFSIIISCSEKEELNNNQEITAINYEELNVNIKNYADSFVKTFSSEKSIEQAFQKYYTEKSINTIPSKAYSSPQTKVNTTQIQEISFETPSFYSDLNNSLILEFYTDMINAYDYEIPEIIDSYQKRIDNHQILLSLNEKEQFQTILNSSKYAVQVLESLLGQKNNLSKRVYSSKRGGFWNCMKKTAGKKIGRGIAGGAITGAIAGAKIGAVGGTVALPGVGTATGAVGGAVFGGAKGAVVGGAVAALWASADCLATIQKKSNYVISIQEFFGEEEPLVIDISLFELEDDTEIKLILKSK